MSRPASQAIVVGVLSDTHGHLYPQVKQLLLGVDHIIHAGDVGSPTVLADLQAIAPVTAVRGNCDHEAWAQMLPARAEVELGGVRVLVGHVAAQLRERVRVAAKNEDGPALAVVVTGHSHLAAMETRDGVLHLNPGSAGPKRFERPRSIARLTIRPGSLSGDTEAGARVEAAILTVKDS
ncbi:MAG: hypothetical protein A2133_10795 [Actinobacteria bacterium RBG_16_64_13]|nr:MAG: hypothetical protein A2133_10795 [Actinobacteria bacterium RBG_16_64_13]